MPIYDFQCENPECKHTEEFIVSPSVKDEVPEICPKCKKGKLIKQFPASNNRTGIDVVGGYEYQYGKKAFKKKMSPLDYAGHLVKGEDGKFKDPY